MNIQSLPLSFIDPNPSQPRTRFVAIDALAASIATDGLLEPIMVRPIGDRWQIVHGERRYRAAQSAGLAEIPAIVRDLTDDEAFALALVENMQRENLGPLEEAAAFAALIARGKTQAEIGALVGKTQSYVAQKLRLLRLPAPLTHFLNVDALTENHLRQAMRLRDLYPPGLRAVNGPSAVWDSLFADLRDEGAARALAWQMFHSARPEEVPTTWPREALSPTIVEGCRHLAVYVAKHTDGIPQWELAAFWWLALAVDHGMSVSRLARRIDKWAERYESALCWWYILRETPEPEEAYGWSVYGDLKHSASLDLDIDDDAHHRAYLASIWGRWQPRGFLFSPSEIQMQRTLSNLGIKHGASA